MVTWWDVNLKKLASMKFTKGDYVNLVLESRLLFRNGIENLFDTSERLGIPFFIVSGGISEIIESHFFAIMNNGEVKSEHAKTCYEKSVIFSNHFHYLNGETVDYEKPIIHGLNKQ